MSALRPALLALALGAIAGQFGGAEVVCPNPGWPRRDRAAFAVAGGPLSTTYWCPRDAGALFPAAGDPPREYAQVERRWKRVSLCVGEAQILATSTRPIEPGAAEQVISDVDRISRASGRRLGHFAPQDCQEDESHGTAWTECTGKQRLGIAIITDLGTVGFRPTQQWVMQSPGDVARGPFGPMPRDAPRGAWSTACYRFGRPYLACVGAREMVQLWRGQDGGAVVELGNEDESARYLPADLAAASDGRLIVGWRDDGGARALRLDGFDPPRSAQVVRPRAEPCRALVVSDELPAWLADGGSAR